MLVSIIIPCFNRENLISETLDSIINQTYKNWECIIVDDGSTDNTLEIIQQYCEKDVRFKFIQRNREPKGAPTCRNIGLENANGTYINWFDSDDIMHKEMLEKKVTLIESNDYDFVACKLANFSSSLEQITYPKYSLKSGNPIKDFISFKLRFYTPGPLFKKDFLIKNNLNFNETLKRHQESELFFKILNITKNYGTIEDYLIYRRIHDESIAKKEENNNNDFIYFETILDYALKNNIVSKANFETFYQLTLKYIYVGLKTKNNVVYDKSISIMNELFNTLSFTKKNIQYVLLYLKIFRAKFTT